MSWKAWVYIWITFLAALLLTVQAFLTYTATRENWFALGLLVVMATFAQLYRADGPNHQALFATPIFLFAGLLLLPKALFCVLVALPHLLEWLQSHRQGGAHLRAWYIQPFNIAMHTIAGGAALWVFEYFQLNLALLPAAGGAFELFAAALTYLFVNQLLLGQAFVLARGMSWRESGVLARDNLLPEFLMICIGASLTTLWQVNLWLIPFALAPLGLIYRALLVPKLKEEAQTDSKTGLFNARYFHKRYQEEFERAQRFQRPLAFIMADLDLLRNINNSYGHIAGDVVLEGIGKIIRKQVREYDVAGRFGGEEFAIVLPESSTEKALVLAERIRRAVEEARFEIPSSPTPIRATMSLGIASYPEDAQTIIDLNHKADEAVYQAKYLGRNCVFSASNLPHVEMVGKTLASGGALMATAIGEPEPGLALNKPAQPQPQLHTPVDAPAPASIGSAQAVDQPGRSDERQSGPNQTGPVPQAKAIIAGGQRRIGRTALPLQLLLLVALVIGLGTLAAIVGVIVSPRVDLVALILLVTLALIVELRQISVYGEHSISASLTVIVAAGLIIGMPGIVATSAAIAVADQFRQRRPAHDYYKVLYNWSTHVLSGLSLPVVLMFIPIQLSIANIVPLLLTVAILGGLYYIVESLLISAAISISKGTNLIQTWQGQLRWLSGHYVALSVIGLFLALAYTTLGLAGVFVFILPVLMMGYVQQQYVTRTQDSVRELRRMNQELTRANQEIRYASYAVQQVNDELFETLACFYDTRDPYAGGHSAKVADYASAIATELQFAPERVKHLRQAALLHDIGKIAISEEILFKPGKLSYEEYQVIKRHPTIGANLLEMSQGLRHLASFVRYHHERWDGKGYPEGLKGEAIPLEARILNLCDSVEAMASDRPYSPALSLEAILDEVRRNAGTQFDPEIAAIFIQIAEPRLQVVNSASWVTDRLQARMSVRD